MNTILVIDVGLGNIASVVNAIERSGGDVVIWKSSEDIKEEGKISHIVLPGVGTYNQGMKNLQDNGWCEWIKKMAKLENKPILGICLGMQLMSDSGLEGKEEYESDIKGLGLISGKVESMERKKLRVPHTGWNNVAWSPWETQINHSIFDNTDFYFVHSYHFQASNTGDIIGKVDYGEGIVAAVRSGNIVGVQFHPEKSQKAGAKIINNFLRL